MISHRIKAIPLNIDSAIFQWRRWEGKTPAATGNGSTVMQEVA